MAGEWIPMRTDLLDDPAVIQMAAALGVDEYAIAGRLLKLWSWANRHLKDGHAAVPDNWVDDYLDTAGFAAAMLTAGWLRTRSGGGLEFTSFDRWNSNGAKIRLGETLRKRAFRGRQGAKAGTPAGPETVPKVSRTNPGPEESREEKSKDNTPSGCAAPPPAAAEIVPDPPPAPKPRKEPDGLHHELIRVFVAAWEARYATRYPFDGGKDAAAVKWIRKQTADAETFRGVVGRYLADESEFVTEARHSLALLRSQWVRFAVEPPPGGQPQTQGRNYGFRGHRPGVRPDTRIEPPPGAERKRPILAGVPAPTPAGPGPAAPAGEGAGDRGG